MSIGHAEWIGNFSLGHRLWETAATFVTGETSDIIARPGAAGAVRSRRSPWSSPRWPCSPSARDREERRAAALPLTVALAAVGIPVLLALSSPSKDYVLARNVMPALIPLLIAVAIAVTLPAARRVGAILGAALLAYSLGFCVWASVSPDLQRPDWSAVAAKLGEPQAPRATVTWALGEAPLRYYLSTGAIQVTPADGYDWLVHEVDFVSDGKVPPPAAAPARPRLPRNGSEDTGRLFIRRFRQPGPGLAPLRLRRAAQRRSSTSAPTAFCWTESGPADVVSPPDRVEGYPAYATESSEEKV